mgnify:FL=1
MLIRKLIIGLLSFYAIEVKRASLKNTETSPIQVQHELELEIVKKREAKKQRTRLYDKRKWKKKQRFKEPAFKIKGTNPKDVLSLIHI